MKTRTVAALLVLTVAAWADYRNALPGYPYEFPRDHFNHPEFKTEWWYYTGNLRAADGHRFGFELTFFRVGTGDTKTARNVWDIPDVWLAHLALSDIDGKRFFHTQRLNRAGTGLAGADQRQERVWNGNWFVELKPEMQRLEAVADEFRIGLSFSPAKPPVIHGINGVSQKAAGEGRASHYISFTRLIAKGSVIVGGRQFTVDGLAWMDHEFFTNWLDRDQAGWDWFSMQFEDGTELMLGRLRRKDGSTDPYSAGTFVDKDGRGRHLTVSDFVVTPGPLWTSKETGGRYPVEWTVRVPPLGIEAAVTTRLPDQELTSKLSGMPVYWEGAIEISGKRGGAPLNGTGYLEMTGYAGQVRLGR